MCAGCWTKKGRPIVDTPAIRRAASTIAQLYKLAPAGGALHIFTDDWNVEDDHLAFCASMIGHHSVWDQPTNTWTDVPNDPNDPDDPPAKRAAERAVVEAFQPLTEPERLSALALADGYWTIPDNVTITP